MKTTHSKNMKKLLIHGLCMMVVFSVQAAEPSKADKKPGQESSAPKKIDIRRHGNWCGPNYSGGQVSKDNENMCRKDWKPPVDETDKACQKHDMSYGVNGITKDTPNSNPAKQKADKQLVEDLSNAKTKGPIEKGYNEAAQEIFKYKVKKEEKRK